MAGFIGGRTSAFDYIGPSTPDKPQNGEMWFDTDGASDGSGEVKVYDAESGAWEPTGFTSHAVLSDVTRAAPHPPVDVFGPLTQPSDQSLGLSIGDGLANSSGTLVAALGNGLGIDGLGQVYIPASAVSQSMLGFDTATQSELDNHAGDTTNPHNVTDDQTGAASALSNHAADGTAHHSRPSSTNTHYTETEWVTPNHDGPLEPMFGYAVSAHNTDSYNTNRVWLGDGSKIELSENESRSINSYIIGVDSSAVEVEFAVPTDHSHSI